MGFLDRLLGRTPLQHQGQQQAPGGGGGSWSTSGGPTSQSGQPFRSAPGRGGDSEDERAVARYRYLLRTAPPESLEQVHAEAFARLTPEQRQQVLAELTQGAAQGEAPASAEPQDLARAATRAEMRQPGTLERTFGRGSFGGMGMGGTLMGSMMGTIAGVVVGSAIANTLFDGYGDSPEAADAGESGADAGGDGGSDAGGSDTGDAGGDVGGDAGGAGWGDGGSDYSAGSDFGGGDFGGGDFGGGDFGGGGF